MLSAYVLPLLLAGLAWQPADASPLYKWVDRTGQVTYSSRPPPAGIQAEKVQAPPQPTAEEVRQTEERAKKIEEKANELEAQRRQQEAQAAEEARLRAIESPPAPVVIEKPVYVPQPTYYPPPMKPPRRHHENTPKSDRHQRTRSSGTPD